MKELLNQQWYKTKLLSIRLQRMKYINKMYLRKHYFGSSQCFKSIMTFCSSFCLYGENEWDFYFCAICDLRLFFAVSLVRNQLNQVYIVMYVFRGVRVPKYSPSFIDNYRMSHRGVWMGLFQEEAGKNILLNQWFTQKWQLYSYSYLSKPVWVLKQLKSQHPPILFLEHLWE